MLKLFKYLKTSIISVLIIIALLICQATLDLSLPDYTSKIINVGIGKNGIEDATIKVISGRTLDDLMLFLNSEEKEFINSHYVLAEKNKSMTGG